MGDEANAIRRVIRILEEAALRGGHIRFAEATALLAPVGPNTVARLLRELVRAGVLERGRDRSYALTDKPMFWAASVPRGRDLRAVARPQLVRLNRELAATAALVVPYGGRMTILDRILDAQSPSLMGPGEFAPLNPVYAGGVFLAPSEQLADPEVLARWLEAAPQRKIEVSGLRRLIDRSLIEGVIVDPGLFFPSVFRVAAPVHGDGRVVACLAIGASPLRGRDFLATAAEPVRAAAAAMGQALARQR